MSTPRRTLPKLLVALAALSLYAPAAWGDATNRGSDAPAGGGAARYAARAARPVAPVVTGVHCYKVGSTACAKGPHTVQITGELVLSGHHLRPGDIVFFARAGAKAARVKPLGATLRPTGHGIAVTIPRGAASGRIYVSAAPSVRSPQARRSGRHSGAGSGQHRLRH